jgi:LysR family transcriptional regulator, nitrogen assimilation regulatory protein
MHTNLIDPEVAELFLCVAEVGSLSKAAERTGKSQPHISRVMAGLEAEWGGRLFRRTGRGVALTDFGEVVAPRVKEWLTQTQDLVEGFKTYAGNPNGEVKIGTLPSTSSPIMSALFVRVRKRFPGIRLRFKEGYHSQIQSWLESGQVDIGVVLAFEPTPRGDDIPLIEFDAFLCGAGGDSVTRSGTVEFSTLLELPLIVPSKPGILTRHLDMLCSQYGKNINTILEVNSLALQRDIVAAGNAYAILSYAAVASDVKAGRIQASRIVNPSIIQYLSVGLSKHGPITKVTREVLQQLKELMPEIEMQVRIKPSA